MCLRFIQEKYELNLLVCTLTKSDWNTVEYNFEKFVSRESITQLVDQTKIETSWHSNSFDKTLPPLHI